MNNIWNRIALSTKGNAHPEIKDIQMGLLAVGIQPNLLLFVVFADRRWMTA
jgi:hypothetical protein